MRTFKGIGIGLISFVILFLLIGTLLSDTQTVEREVWLKAKQKDLDAIFHNPERWKDWHTQLKDNPNVELKSAGKEKTAILEVKASNGMYSLLKADSVGNGFFSFTTTSGKEEQGIRSLSSISYLEEDGTVILKFSNEYYLGNNPFYKFVGLGFDDIMGPETEDMIDNISNLVEKKK